MELFRLLTLPRPTVAPYRSLEGSSETRALKGMPFMPGGGKGAEDLCAAGAFAMTPSMEGLDVSAAFSSRAARPSGEDGSLAFATGAGPEDPGEFEVVEETGGKAPELKAGSTKETAGGEPLENAPAGFERGEPEGTRALLRREDAVESTAALGLLNGEAGSSAESGAVGVFCEGRAVEIPPSFK